MIELAFWTFCGSAFGYFCFIFGRLLIYLLPFRLLDKISGNREVVIDFIQADSSVKRQTFQSKDSHEVADLVYAVDRQRALREFKDSGLFLSYIVLIFGGFCAAAV